MRVAAVLAGSVLYALAMPPFDWAVCGWLTLVPVLLAVRGQSTAAAFRYGLLYGYAFGWAISWCFAVAAARYFQLPFPVAIALLSLWYLVVCGVPFGLFTAAYARITRSPAGRRLHWALAPAAWVASEYVRGGLVQQPWCLLGYTQHAQVGLIQVATLTGVYGVSAILAMGSAVVADLLDRFRARRGSMRSAVAGAVVPVAIIAVCWAGGSVAARNDGERGHAQVAIVQTNVSPSYHWTRSYTDGQIAAHLRATERLPRGGPALIVWPENSVPQYLEREPMLAVRLAAAATYHQADLLFGGPRFEDGRTYNSARLITSRGRNGGSYDKRRLVLFAEEKPFSAGAETTRVDSPEEFAAGSGSGVLQSFVRLGVSICHEIVHPDLIRESVRDGAELLVNIANDGWLDGGFQFAGRQHLAMTVFRAVETRRFVVRAATTGPSAIIDPYGRILASQGPDTAGLVVAGVRGERAITPYVQHGDAFALACLWLVLAQVVVGFARTATARRLVADPLVAG